MLCTVTLFTVTLLARARVHQRRHRRRPVVRRNVHHVRRAGVTPVALRQPVQLLDPVRRRALEFRLHHFGSRNAVLQPRRRIQRRQLAVIDNGDAVAQLVRFIHVMRGQQNRQLGFVAQRANHLPHVAFAKPDRAPWSARPET